MLDIFTLEGIKLMSLNEFENIDEILEYLVHKKLISTLQIGIGFLGIQEANFDGGF